MAPMISSGSQFPWLNSMPPSFPLPSVVGAKEASSAMGSLNQVPPVTTLAKGTKDGLSALNFIPLADQQGAETQIGSSDLSNTLDIDKVTSFKDPLKGYKAELDSDSAFDRGLESDTQSASLDQKGQKQGILTSDGSESAGENSSKSGLKPSDSKDFKTPESFNGSKGSSDSFVSENTLDGSSTVSNSNTRSASETSGDGKLGSSASSSTEEKIKASGSISGLLKELLTDSLSTEGEPVSGSSSTKSNHNDIDSPDDPSLKSPNNSLDTPTLNSYGDFASIQSSVDSSGAIKKSQLKSESSKDSYLDTQGSSPTESPLGGLSTWIPKAEDLVTEKYRPRDKIPPLHKKDQDPKDSPITYLNLEKPHPGQSDETLSDTSYMLSHRPWTWTLQNQERIPRRPIKELVKKS